MYLQILAINKATRGIAKYSHVDIDEQVGLAYEDTDEDLGKWGGLTPAASYEARESSYQKFTDWY